MSKIISEVAKAKIAAYNLQKSYDAYVNQLTKLQQKHGTREAVTFEEFQQRYYEKQIEGGSAKNLSTELSRGAVVFTRADALNIAHILVDFGTEEQITDVLGLEVTYNKDGTMSVNNLVNQIVALGPVQAHDFVSAAIDEGLYNDGDDFEAFTY